MCLLLCLVFVAVSDLLLPAGEAAVYESVIRLHILANSDAEDDQTIKLAVRDEILKTGVFEGASTMAEAEEDIKAAAEKAVDTANAYLKNMGVPYTASCVFGRESYPTRVYEGVRLPAGEYLSLRIVLGKGEGKNWWCVLFPPLCTGAATKKLTGDRSDAIFDRQNKRYIFRFKILEWLFS